MESIWKSQAMRSKMFAVVTRIAGDAGGTPALRSVVRHGVGATPKTENTGAGKHSTSAQNSATILAGSLFREQANRTLREHVLLQALALPPHDQAFVAHALENHLISTLPPETEEAAGVSGDALLAELRRRSAAYHAGMTTARDAADVMTDLRQRQAHESKT